MQRGITASPFLLQPALTAASSLDHHHARASGQHRLGASQSDARRSPGHNGNLAFQFSCHRSLSLLGAVLLAPADRIAPNGGVTPARAETAQLLEYPKGDAPSSLSSLR